MVIGGAEVYRACLPSAGRIHLTLVHAVVADGDAFFPEWRAPGFREVFREHHGADARHAHAFSFITLERERPPRQPQQ
jgi:dihydrofolate reductase